MTNTRTSSNAAAIMATKYHKQVRLKKGRWTRNGDMLWKNVNLIISVDKTFGVTRIINFNLADCTCY